MRILMINHGYFGGGAERCARELRQGLLDRGHDVDMWVANPADHLPSNVIPITYPWEKYLLSLDMVADLTDWRHRGSIHALKTINPELYDLIHIHSIHGGWISLTALEQACRRFPSVWTLHDEWALTNGYICDLNDKIDKSQMLQHTHGLGRLLGRSPYHDNFKNRRVGRLQDRTIPRSPLLIAPSRHILKMIHECRRFASSESTHIYHGLSMLQEPARHMSRHDARNKWGIDQARPVILMVAAHLQDFHKGIRLGLEAIEKISAEVKPHLFLLGRNADSLRQYLSTTNITTAYASDNAQLAWAYRAADVTLIPSIGEALSYVALESLACQTPLVAFDIGGPGEIIGDNAHGLVAQPYDTDELAKHLQTLLTDRNQLVQMGEAGCRWVQEQCDFSRYMDRIEHCYDVAITSFRQKHTTGKA